MNEELFSVEQVADRLGLHVRTVRAYVRDGRLKAVRIGKQYRIARADLEALTGGPVPPSPREAARHRHVEVSSVVQVDAVDAGTAHRITTTLVAAAQAPREGGDRLQVQSVYDEERARLRVIVAGGAASTAGLLRLVAALAEEEEK